MHTNTNKYIEPLNVGFTIYTKSGCIMCSKVKNLLTEKFLFFEVVDCDEYLLEDKEDFLSFMEKKIGSPYKQFPMVFSDGVFIGGYKETSDALPKLLLDFTLY